MSAEAVPESVVARLRPHSRVLFWPTIALIVDAGAVSYFAGSLPEPWMNIAILVAAGLIALLVFVIPLLTWLGRNYTITTRRIVIRSGLLVRTRQELLHSRGYDVTVRKAGLQLIFGSGDVRINTGLEHPVELKDIPDADLVQSALHDLMEASLNPIAARRQQEQSRPGQSRPEQSRPEQSGPDDETQAWGSR